VNLDTVLEEKDEKENVVVDLVVAYVLLLQLNSFHQQRLCVVDGRSGCEDEQ